MVVLDVRHMRLEIEACEVLRSWKWRHNQQFTRFGALERCACMYVLLLACAYIHNRVSTTFGGCGSLAVRNIGASHPPLVPEFNTYQADL